MMTMKEAMAQRHTVRKFKTEAIPADKVELLNAKIDELNEKFGLSMKLVTGNKDGLKTIFKFVGKGAFNYFVLAGPDSAEAEEKLGYCGSELCLYAQTIGLNTWWIGGMFSMAGVQKAAGTKDAKINSIIVVGYGEVQGKPHKSKRAADIASYEGEIPEWFEKGVEAVLLAPTAINRQAFTIKGAGSKVSMTYKPGPFSGVDLGIGKHHFELGAGTENFEWE